MAQDMNGNKIKIGDFLNFKSFEIEQNGKVIKINDNKISIEVFDDFSVFSIIQIEPKSCWLS